MVRYDDESIVHEKWIRQRYDCGCVPSLAPARRATVETAWHEAATRSPRWRSGPQFSSASIHHGRSSEGRVHGISDARRPGLRGGRGRPGGPAAADLVHAGPRRGPARLAADLAQRRRGCAAVPGGDRGPPGRQRGRGVAAQRGGADPVAAADPPGGPGTAGAPQVPAVRGHRRGRRGQAEPCRSRAGRSGLDGGHGEQPHRPGARRARVPRYSALAWFGGSICR